MKMSLIIIYSNIDNSITRKLLHKVETPTKELSSQFDSETHFQKNNLLSHWNI